MAIYSSPNNSRTPDNLTFSSPPSPPPPHRVTYTLPGLIRPGRGSSKPETLHSLRNLALLRLPSAKVLLPIQIISLLVGSRDQRKHLASERFELLFFIEKRYMDGQANPTETSDTHGEGGGYFIPLTEKDQ